jgi:hypothetical protein
VRVVAVTKHGNIDQVRRHRILPDLAIDATEVDLFVEPTANPVVASVGNEVWETADVFVLPPVSADCLRSPPSRASRHDPSRTEETAGPIVPFARAFVEGTADG